MQAYTSTNTLHHFYFVQSTKNFVLMLQVHLFVLACKNDHLENYFNIINSNISLCKPIKEPNYHTAKINDFRQTASKLQSKKICGHKFCNFFEISLMCNIRGYKFCGFGIDCIYDNIDL